MKNQDKVAVAVAGGLLATGAFLWMKSAGGVGKFFLQITTGNGGTTTPAPSPSGLLYPPNEVVTITAHPDVGFTVGVWLLDGVEVGNQPSIQVTMNFNHTVIVTFWEGGTPPPTAPYGIVPYTASPTVLGYYGCRIDVGLLNYITNVAVHNCDQNWTWDNWAQYPAAFKVIDASGQGVPNINVNLYPDIAPDNGNNAGLVGFLALNLYPHTKTEPLQLTSDANGLVNVSLSYAYALSDQKRKLCQAAQLWYNALAPAGSYVPYDGSPTGQILVGKGGGGITNQVPTMGAFLTNYIRAQVVGTAIPEALMLTYCGFHVKML